MVFIHSLNSNLFENLRNLSPDLVLGEILENWHILLCCYDNVSVGSNFRPLETFPFCSCLLFLLMPFDDDPVVDKTGLICLVTAGCFSGNWRGPFLL